MALDHRRDVLATIARAKNRLQLEDALRRAHEVDVEHVGFALQHVGHVCIRQQRAELLGVIEHQIGLGELLVHAAQLDEPADVHVSHLVALGLGHVVPRPPERHHLVLPELTKSKVGVAHLPQVLRVAHVVHDRPGHRAVLTCDKMRSLRERAGRTPGQPRATGQGDHIATTSRWRAHGTHRGSHADAHDVKLHHVDVETRALRRRRR
mmetsp:Transcript_6941/g.31336  ORF Transcript_6941/g.31336 Transcript_6941/m.31336 type:complete len:208 (-) Transcript_6941:194-817(-)